MMRASSHALHFNIVTLQQNNTEGYFSLENDDFDLFWVQRSLMNTREEKKMTVKEIADYIWEQWLGCIGIEF